jgi:hypothetical protein
MKTLAALSLAVLLGAAGSASAQDSHADGKASDSAAARIQSTSPQAATEGKAAVEEHTGTAVRAAGKAHADSDAPAASGAGEATARARPKARTRTQPDSAPKADSDTTADAAGGAWPGKNVDSSEIT